jgi:hypothetical protein
MQYQVAKIEASEQDRIFFMTNGESVLVKADGSRQCRNANGRGLARSGRFAHLCAAMLRAVDRHQS